MTCPRCGKGTGVVDSRNYPTRVRRRRVCRSCKFRFTTYERVTTDVPRTHEVCEWCGNRVKGDLTIMCQDDCVVKRYLDKDAVQPS